MTDLSADREEAVPGAPATSGAPVGLVIDWGGVLTGSLDAAMSAWAHRDGVDYSAFRDVLRQWVGRRAGDDAPTDPVTGDPVTGDPVTGNPVTGEANGARGASVAELEQASDAGPAGDSPMHRLERGEMETVEFERELAAELAIRGSHVPPEGLLARILAGLAELDPRMVDLVRRARATGLRTALLSNSWGLHYPEALWDGLFDAVVISGEVGMRKPELEIFHYTAHRLRLPPGRCVMVDDLPHNFAGAVAAGMVGVLHRSYDETLLELEALFEVVLG